MFFMNLKKLKKNKHIFVPSKQPIILFLKHLQLASILKTAGYKFYVTVVKYD